MGSSIAFGDLETMNDEKSNSLVSRRGSREGLVASGVWKRSALDADVDMRAPERESTISR
jgi:hypothetical protein